MILQATGQELIIVDKTLVVSGTVGVYTAQFELSDEWTDYAITAVFKSAVNGTYEVLLDSNNECTIPYEVIAQPDFLQIGIYGVNGADRYPAIYTERIYINTGTEQGEPPSEPTQDLYDQMLNLVQQANTIAANVQAQADNGDFDGFSPTATVEAITDGVKITITDKNGTTTQNVTNGEQGATGADGYSPSANVTAITGGVRVSITDKNGTTTQDVMNGINGADGANGADGFSPIATVEAITGGAKITITDKNGTTTQNVLNGVDGANGTNGTNGTTFTPSVSNAGVISWTNNGGLPNPASVDLASAAQGVFFAVYNVTTTAEILAAIQAGKFPIAVYQYEGTNEYLYLPLFYSDTDNNTYIFNAVDTNSLALYTISIDSTDVWSTLDDYHLVNDTNGYLDSPTLDGTPTAPTATTGTNTDQIATTAFVQQEIAAAIINAIGEGY